jgi:putative heme-binding domain-containing protein
MKLANWPRLADQYLAQILAGLLLTAPNAFGASSLPEPGPNWRIELVAEAPRVQHPSVVACAPDGRVFIAEDPMDISLPKADAAEGRILCFYPNGQVTLFATNLFAVFGLQYLEGKLYVLHNPRFTVFEDDKGVGRNPQELIQQTLPNPSALNWNDHVPGNFHLAMDGYFYAASGDKGLHGARGTDGSRADLFSGGIFRLRPDGSGLEVMSHGVRNILDVALNTEDEQFTYDNTDEHDWMGRFTHMVEAGYYGYPHDFVPRRPYTLWMMEDYGAGAACDVFANTEDALPPEFHSDIFLADFGKRQLMRVHVERAGATFRAVSKEDLFPNPPGDFRPVGIAPGPDGKSIFICDWQHRDEKANVSVGRLFKLVWTGPDHSIPKPGWYLAAAMGKEFTATTEELIRGLSHPSRQVRLTAQRRLADRSATNELRMLLRDAFSPVLARTHALWALHAIDGGRSTVEEIIARTADKDPVMRRQSIRELGMGRVKQSLRALRDSLKDGDASVRFQAATALGRIGSLEAIPELLATLTEQDFFARYAVFTALHRIGTNSPAGWPLIVHGLQSDDPRVREGTVFALRETYDEQLVAALVELLHQADAAPTARAAAVELIAALHHQTPPWNGEWWGYHPALEPPPAKTSTWRGTELVLTALRWCLDESDPVLRRTSINALAAARDTNAVPKLREIFFHETDPKIRSGILQALGAMQDPGALTLAIGELKSHSDPQTTAAAIAAAEALGGEESIRALCNFLAVGIADPNALADAVAALGKLRAERAVPAIEPLTAHPSMIVRAASCTALGRLEGISSVNVLTKGLTDPAIDVRRAVVKSLEDLKSAKAVPALLKAYADSELRSEAFTALTRTPDPRALDVLLDGLASKNPVERNAAHLAISELNESVLPTIEAKAGTLSPIALVELRQIYAGNKTAESGPLFSRILKQYSLEEYMDAGTQRAGDPLHGRRIFSEPGGVNCVACHRVAGQGSDLGPDLSGIGAQFDRRGLAESVLYPSKTVREGYQQIVIEMEDGEEFSGLIKGETAEALLLRDSAGREHRLSRAAIKSRRNSLLSLMPDGLQMALSLDDFADLIAYLASLKSKP